MLIRWAIRLVVLVSILLVAILLWRYFATDLFGLAGSAQKEISQHYITLEQIEALGKLELVKYKLKDILEYRIQRPWYQGGDSKALLIVSGEAVGCIDLTRIRKEHILETDSLLIIQLPEPELCYAKINHQETRVYEVETGFLTFDEAQILESCLQAGRKTSYTNSFGK